ncbi:hypothetical protein [Leclercia adecarboxylata]|uniref:hypothetical protein n=1 Tax=Leclercia adecarboxylata TaxID=83655 RepID=UPI003016DB9D
MGSMLELEKTVEEIKRELEIQKHTSQLVFTLIIESINALSPKHNVREVMKEIMKKYDTPHLSSLPSLEETLKRVDHIISKS